MFKQPRQSYRAKSLRPRRLFSQLLRLEDRIAPALTTTFDEVYGVLSVSSNAADSIIIGTDHFSQVAINGTTFVTPLGATIDAAQVRSINVIGGPGNNVIDLSGVGPMAFSGLNDTSNAIVNASNNKDIHDWPDLVIQNPRTVIDGGAGNDTITGSQFADLIDCFQGADKIDGGFGDDLIYIRNDDLGGITINGGYGDNSLFVDYTPVVGATMAISCNADTGASTISYGGKDVTATKIKSAEGPKLVKEIAYAITGNPGPGGGGSIDLGYKTAEDLSVRIIQDLVINPSSGGPSIEFLLGADSVSVAGTLDGWTVRADAGSTPLAIDLTGSGNSLVVNTFDLGSTTTPTTVQVTGMAPITYSGTSSALTEVRLYDAAAIDDLLAHGVSISTNSVDEIDGTVTESVTLSNSGIVVLDDPKLTWSNGSADWISHNRHGVSISKGSSSMVHVSPAAGVSVIVIDDTATQPRRAIDLATGSVPDTTVTFALPDLAGGQSSTNSVTVSRNKVDGKTNTPGCSARLSLGGRTYDIDLSSFFEKGDKPTQSQFAAIIDTSTGKTPTGGGTTLISSDASGQTALCHSAAGGIDSHITTMTVGDHLYAGSQMVDVAPDGHTSGNAPATVADMDLTGRWVVFESSATNLVAGLIDTNGATDIFVRDMLLGKTYCLSSISSVGGSSTGNGASFDPHISCDGRAVIYRSLATNLVAGVTDNNNEPDLFEVIRINPDDTWDLVVGNCVSLVPLTSQTCNKGVAAVDIGGDGINDYTVSYLTDATDTGSPSATGGHLVVKHALANPEYADFTTPMGGKSNGLTVSLDGSTVVLSTDADVSSLLGPGVVDGNNARDILSIDVATGAVTCVTLNVSKSATADGPSPAYAGESVAVSVDGSHLAFTSASSNLITGLLAPASDGVYRFVAGTSTPVERIDINGASSYGSNNHSPSISGVGHTIVWDSTTDYKTGGPAFTKIQSWVKNCYDGVAVSPTAGWLFNAEGGGATSDDIQRVLICPNGDLALCSTFANNVVANDTNGQEDVFADKIGDYQVRLISTDSTGISVIYDAPSDSYQVRNSSTSAVMYSRAAADVRSITIYGRDGVDDTITVDVASGLQRLGGNIVIHGGTGNDKVTVIGLAATAETDISCGAGGLADMEHTRDILQTKFADGTERDLTQRVVTVQCTDVEELDNATNSDRVVVQEFSQLVQVTAAVVAAVRHTEFQGGGTGLRDYSTSPNTSYSLILTTGNDSCTIDTTGLTTGMFENLTVDGNGGTDTIACTGFSGPPRIFIVLPSSGSGLTPAVVTGTSGDDTISIGPGAATLNGGAGNDVYMIGGRFKIGSVPIPITILDSAGNDALDFSLTSGPVAVDFDDAGAQDFTAGSTLQITGTIENGIGGDFDDTFKAKALSVPRFFDGGGQVSATGDTLTFDAQGLPATDFGDRIVTPGYADVKYSEFEHVVFINPAPHQVVLTTVNDEAIQRSMVTKLQTSFNFETMGTLSAAFEVRTKVGGVLQPISVATDTINGFTHVTITPLGSVSFADGRYILRVISAQIPGGLTGGDYTFEFHRLFGDTNGDGAVGTNDFVFFRQAFNGMNDMFDFDGDGFVSTSDFAQFRNRFNTSI
jgi:hypothetical protein